MDLTVQPSSWRASYFILKFRDFLCNKPENTAAFRAGGCYLNHSLNRLIVDLCKVLLITALYYLLHCQLFIKPAEGNRHTIGNSGPVPNCPSARSEPSPALPLVSLIKVRHPMAVHLHQNSYSGSAPAWPWTEKNEPSPPTGALTES